MATSERRIEANRLNALKSTGPRTDEGKARSSRNAMTHGLCAGDLILPGEDEAEVRSFLDQMITSLAPRDMVEHEVAQRMAWTSWKLRRADALDAARTRTRVEQARAAFEERRRRELQAITRIDAVTDVSTRVQFERTPEGCAFLMESIRELLESMHLEQVIPRHEERLMFACGSEHPGVLVYPRAIRLFRAIFVFEWAKVEGEPGESPPETLSEVERTRWNRARRESLVPIWKAELTALLHERLAELDELRQRRLEESEIERQTIPVRAQHDESAEGERFRKAMRAIQNEFHRLRKALTEFQKRVIPAPGSVAEVAPSPAMVEVTEQAPSPSTVEEASPAEVASSPSKTGRVGFVPELPTPARPAGTHRRHSDPRGTASADPTGRVVPSSPRPA